jgi:hypothetical protein
LELSFPSEVKRYSRISDINGQAGESISAVFDSALTSSLLGFLALALSVVPIVLLVSLVQTGTVVWLMIRSKASTCGQSLRSWRVHPSSQGAMTPHPRSKKVTARKLSSGSVIVRSHYQHRNAMYHISMTTRRITILDRPC